MRNPFLAFAGAVLLATGLNAEPSAPAPTLTYAFSVKANLKTPLEHGEIDGKRVRFIGIAGGSVEGPMLSGEVLSGGGTGRKLVRTA